MKKSLLIALLFTFFAVNAQKVSDKHLIVFETYNDYKSGKGKDYGLITDYENSDWGKNKILIDNGFTERDKPKVKVVDLNNFWGYQIGDFIFRMNTYSLRLPMLVLNKNKKVFYIDGYMVMKRAIFDEHGGHTFIESDGCFYSDDLNSQVHEITRMIRNEKGNPELKDMIECIKEAKKRRGVQRQFDRYVECIQL